MKKNTLAKINKLLRHFKHLRYYRGFSRPLRSDRFQAIPYSNKRTVERALPSLDTSRVFNVTATSGTTASSLLIYHSRKCYETHLKRVAETYAICGLQKRDLCLNICSYGLNSGGRIMEQAFKSIGVGVIPFGTITSRDKLKEVVALIKTLRPNVLNSYTNQLFDIFAVLKSRHTIKKCIVNGEPLLPSFKKNVEDISDVRIYNNYGSMEFSGFAISEDPRDEYMRVVEDGLYLEILTEGGTAAEAGRGKLIVTDLENDCMPFIRYKIGDLVELIKRGRNKYLKVLGRTENSILLDGEIFLKTEIVDAVQSILKHPYFFIHVLKNETTLKDSIILHLRPTDKDKTGAIKDLFAGNFNLIPLLCIKFYRAGIPKTSTGKYRHFIDMRRYV